MASNWELSTLGELAEIVMGQSPKGADCNSDGHGTPLLNGPTEFGSNHPYPTQFTTDPKRFSKKYDLLFCVRGSTTGRMNWSDKEYAIGRGLAAFRHKKGKDFQSFLKGIIDIKLPELLASATGSTFPNVSKNQLNDLQVILPPLIEQKAIAHILGSLDDKIELNRQMNETLEAMAQALFKSWFVDFDPVIDNALAAGNAIPDEFMERAEQRKSIEKKDNSDIKGLFPDAFEFTEEMGWIPKGWKSVKLDEMLEVKYGKDHKKLDEGTIPVYGSGGLMRLVKKSLYIGESILIPRKGTLSNLMFVDEEFWTVDTMFFSIPKFSNIAKYMFHHLKLLDLTSMNVGSAVPSMTTKVLNNLDILYPYENTLEEFNRLVTDFYNRSSSLNSQNETLAKLRDTLLPKLMLGELRITDAAALVDEAI